MHASVKDRLLQELQRAITVFYGERPEESEDYGKIINAKRFDTLTGFLSQGRIVFGGGQDKKALFIQPTIMEDVAPDQPLMREEIFGPLLPVYSFQSMEEALAIIGRNPDPLAFYLFTRNAQSERRWMESLRFGGGCINNTDWHFTNHHLPFGGIGSSGIGAYHGRFSFDTFTHAKSVMRTPYFFDLALKYPPFKGKMKWFKRFLR